MGLFSKLFGRRAQREVETALPATGIATFNFPAKGKGVDLMIVSDPRITATHLFGKEIRTQQKRDFRLDLVTNPDEKLAGMLARVRPEKLTPSARKAVLKLGPRARLP